MSELGVDEPDDEDCARLVGEFFATVVRRWPYEGDADALMAAARRPDVLDRAVEMTRGIIAREDRHLRQIGRVEDENRELKRDNEDLIRQNRIMRKTIHARSTIALPL